MTKLHKSKSIGYKIMPIIDGNLMSGFNKNLGVFALCKGGVIEMPGNGIYMSNNRQYVIDNYSGLAEEEVLIAFEFNPDDIKWGNTTDRESEFSVPSAKIIGFQFLLEGELIKNTHHNVTNELGI